MGEWRQCRLGSVVELKRGYDLPAKARARGTIPLISSSGVTDYVARAMVQAPGVVTGRYGTLGQVFFLEQPFWPLNTTLYARDFKGNDPRFIGYLLETVNFMDYSDKAAVPGLNRNDLHEAVVLVPLDPQEQRNIANVISRLDNKVELNRRSNLTLEVMAQAIFRDWFVDFGPVRRKQEGADDPVAILGGVMSNTRHASEIAAMFPDALDDNDLPAGWELRPLEGILHLAYGKALPKAAREDGDVPVYGSGGIAGTHSQALAEGPGIIVGRKGTVGSLFWESRDFYAIDTVFFVKPEEGVSLHFVWTLLQTLGLETMNTDAAVPGLNRNNAHRLEVIHPDRPLIEAFGELAGKFRTKMDSADAENRTLAETRDYLLPRLMSGKVGVAEAERIAD